MGALWNGDPYSLVEMQTRDSAMLMESIVKNILSYSSMADLKQQRFVCKQWNEKSRKILREKLTISFSDYHLIKSYSLVMYHQKDFCASFRLGPEICLQAPVVTYFLTEFGHCIRSIEIKNLSQINLSALKQALYYLLPNLEQLTLITRISYSGGMFAEHGGGIWILRNLKKLSLCIEYSPEMSNQVYFNLKNNCLQEPVVPLLLQEILLAATNVEEITSVKREGPTQTMKSYDINDINVEYFDYIMDQPLISDFNIWSTLLEDHGAFCFPKLNKIDLNVKLSDQCVQNLATKWFPLTSIDLNLGPHVTNQNLQYLFSSLKETLTNIKLKYDCREKRPEYEVDLPVTEFLNNVKTVDLEGYQGSLKFVGKIPYLNQMILRRVQFNKTVLQDKEECPKSNFHMNSLKVYEDYSKNVENGPKRSIQMVQKLGQLFPSLRRLRLEKLVDDSLCLVYAQWPNIEELEIVEGLFTDSGTTGIHPNAYRVILREEAYDMFNVQALRQGPYIGNLTKLTKLNIHSPKLTDVSIILGVLQCPSLTSLYVQSYWITDTTLRRILNMPNLVFIETENCNQLSQEMMAFTEQKLQEVGRNAKLNKCKGPMNCFRVRDFLRKHPKLKITLKRLNVKPEQCKKIDPVVSNDSDTNSNNNDQADIINQSSRRRGRSGLRILP